MSSSASEDGADSIPQAPKAGGENDDGFGTETTVDPEDDSDTDYNVEGILAHKYEDGIEYYLLKWQGYGMHASSWEPVDNLSDDLPEIWKAKKARIDAGEELPFDIVDLYKAKYAHWMARYMRSRKRNAKRLKLGQKRSSTEKKLHKMCLEWKSIYHNALKQRRKLSAKKNNEKSKKTDSVDRETSQEEFSLFVSDDNYQSTDLDQGNFDRETSQSAAPIPSGPANPDEPQEASVDTSSAPTTSVTSRNTARAVKESSNTRKKARGCEGSNEKSTTPGQSREASPTIIEIMSSPPDSPPMPTPAPPRPQSRLPKVLMKPVPASAEPKLPSSSKPAGTGDSKAAGNIFVSGRLPPTRKRKASVSTLHETDDEGVDHRFAEAASQSRERRIFMKARRDRAPLQKLKLFDITGIGQNGFDIPTDSNDPEHQTGPGEVIFDTNDSILSTNEFDKFHKTVRFTSTTETWDYESQHSTTPSDDNFRRIDSVPKHRLAISPRPSFKSNAATIQNDTLVSVTKDVFFQRLSDSSAPAPKPVEVTFSDVNATIVPEWFQAFESIANILFSHQCAIKAFEMQSGSIRAKNENLSSGLVTSASAPDALRNMANRLRVGSFCCISFQHRYSIVLYPLRCPLWFKSTEVQSPPDSNAADIGYFIFEMMYEAVPRTLNTNFKVADADLCGRKLLYEKILLFDYNKLLPISSAQPNTSHAFFVMFPESKVDIMSAFCNWLRDCDPKCRILTSQQPGHFETFSREVSCGTVVIHQSAIPLMRHMVGLYKMLRTKPSSINFWVFNEADQLFPLVPSYTEPGRRCSPAKITLSPILQHGVAFLLTPSFLLSQPGSCISLLEKFKELRENDSSYRLVVFNNIREVALELARGTHFQISSADNKYRLWELLNEVMDPQLDPYIQNYSGTDESVITAPSLIHEYDEQSLVNWFSVWASMNLDRHREFIVMATLETNKKTLLPAMVSPVKFTAHAVSKPDAAYEIMTQVSTLPSVNNPSSLAPIQALDQPLPAQRFTSALLSDNRGSTIHQYLYRLKEKHVDSSVFLYMYPVAYKNHEQGDQAGDPLCKYFATFSMWMQFWRPTSSVQKNNRRVYAGVFYTPDFNSPDFEKSKPASVPRKPWIGMVRAVESSTRPRPNLPAKKDFELIIWDPNARFLPKKNLSLSLLDEAQRSFVDFLKSSMGNKLSGSNIVRVWLTGFMVPEEYHATPLDATLVAIENVMEDMLNFMPSTDIKLIDAGYVEVNMEVSQDQDSTEDEFLLDMTPIGPITPSADETMFTVVHPPPSIGLGRSTSECRNLFFDAVTEAQWKEGVYKPFQYTLQPTMSWYRVQWMENREYSHVSVVPWIHTFSRFKITNKKPPQTD